MSESLPVRIVKSPVLDTDGDGLPDSWEQTFFGSLFTLGGHDDPDGDGVDNLGEYAADTHPGDRNDFFAVDVRPGSNGSVELMFDASTGRLYSAQFAGGSVGRSSTWTTASAPPFRGRGGSQVWVDDGSETGVHPASVTQRVYRVQVQAP